MRIVVLGGAGHMGSEAARALAASGEVKKVIVADDNRRAAEKLCEILGGKAEFEQFDAMDHGMAVKAVRKCDAALNCLGGYGIFEVKMVRAAMDAGVNYASICDDVEATEASLAMDREIKRAGICVLSGMGWTPGLSNALARKCMAGMDKAVSVRIAWAANACGEDGVTAIKHLLRMFRGDATVREAGKWKKVHAGSGEETVEFPGPVGALPVFNVAHPEVVTIPHFYGSVENVGVKGGLAPMAAGRLCRMFSRLHMAETPGARDRAAAFVNLTVPAAGKTPGGASALRVDVYGLKDGAPAHHTATAADTICRFTGIPAAVGAIMIGKGDSSKKGFMTPETAFDTDVFLDKISQRGLKVMSKTES